MSHFDERTADDRAGGKSPIPGEPGAVKVACPVRRGVWGNTVRLCALRLPYLVNSKPAGKAGLQMTFGGHGDRVHPCDETYSYGFEIDPHDLPNRVNFDVVWDTPPHEASATYPTESIVTRFGWVAVLGQQQQGIG